MIMYVGNKFTKIRKYKNEDILLNSWHHISKLINLKIFMKIIKKFFATVEQTFSKIVIKYTIFKIF